MRKYLFKSLILLFLFQSFIVYCTDKSIENKYEFDKVNKFGIKAIRINV